jgi:DNA-binding NtrC family response regulator
MPQSSSHAVQEPPVEVLVVEDEAETCELLSQFCRRHGLGVTTAQDGRAAIAALQRDPARFAIVITDLHLPGADGFEVLKAARYANASAYVVIITGYATMDSAIRAVREGAYDYLAKPFALGQLEIVIRRIRDRMALERENRALLSQQAHGSPDPAHSRDLSWRLGAIEERLARIEALLTARGA